MSDEAKTITITLTTGMQCYLQQILIDGLDGATVEQLCERLICEGLRNRTGVKNKQLLNGDAWAHMEHIARVAATAFSTSYDEVVGRKRNSEIVDARHAAMYAAMQCKRYSNARVSHFFKCDHTTVMHGVKKVSERCAQDPLFKRTVGLVLEVACA